MEATGPASRLSILLSRSHLIETRDSNRTQQDQELKKGSIIQTIFSHFPRPHHQTHPPIQRTPDDACTYCFMQKRTVHIVDFDQGNDSIIKKIIHIHRQRVELKEQESHQIAQKPSEREKESEEELKVSEWQSIDHVGVFLKFLKKGEFRKDIASMSCEERELLKSRIENYKKVFVAKFELLYQLRNLENFSTKDVFLKMKTYLEDQTAMGESEKKEHLKLERLFRVEKAYQKVQRNISQQRDAELMLLIFEGNDEDRELLALAHESIINSDSLLCILNFYLKNYSLCEDHLLKCIHFLNRLAIFRRNTVFFTKEINEIIEEILEKIEKQSTMDQQNVCHAFSQIKLLFQLHSEKSPRIDKLSKFESSKEFVQGFIGRIVACSEDPRNIIKELSVYLLQIQSSLYCGLNAHDLIRKPHLDSSPLKKDLICKIFNQIALHLVVDSILHEKSLEGRVSLIKFYYATMEKCCSYGDITSAWAIFAGLEHSAVSRLRNSFETAEMDKNTQEIKVRMDDLFSPFHNCINMRNFIEVKRKSGSPLIPPFSLFNKDFIHIEENSSIVPFGGLISYNYAKLELVQELIARYLEFQGSVRKFIKRKLAGISEDNPFLPYFMGNFAEDDADALDALSYALEPKRS